MLSRLRGAVARWLEEGTFSGPSVNAVADGVGRVARRSIARPLVVPHGMRVVTVGGATLGGSGKTRVALAVARTLAEGGASVVLIGHAYRASPHRARVVAVDDALDVVGDEALAAARTLDAATRSARRVRVVVAPSRQEAVDYTAALESPPDVVILDGPLQLRPVRASLSLLAVDLHRPWGAGAPPPAGDLRASPQALCRHANYIVPVDALARVVTVDGVAVPPSCVTIAHDGSASRVGLFTALGRPDRLERALERAGIPLEIVIRAPNHGPIAFGTAQRIRRAAVDRWLVTEKCAIHLASVVSPRAMAVIDSACVLPTEVELALGSLKPG